MARAKSAPKDSTANLGFEAKLWLAADKLRNNMDAAEYRHVVLGLIFLKYISADFVLANGRMSLNQSGEGETRRALIKAARVDCMVVLPGQFFNSLQFPVYLWFRGKSNTFNSANGARLFDGKTELSLVA